MNIKRMLSLVLTMTLCFGILTACGTESTSSRSTVKETEASTLDQNTASKKQHSIVCTIFPEYDWVREILGKHQDRFTLTMLLNNGVDLHSYQPTAEDLVKIANCDIFIYIGGESDEWVKDVLKESDNPNREVINLLDVLGNSVKEEEIVEGMEAEEEEEEGPEYDEHIWLSLRNAQTLIQAITDAIKEIDADNADDYQANFDSYCSKLSDLDKRYKAAVDTAPVKTVVFGDRFPFRYLVDDYGLDYYAAFAGCSAETEASFETVIFLAQKVDELGLKYVCAIENSDRKIAQTIINNTKNKDQAIVSLDSMQSTTSKDAESGTTYLSLMEQNLDALSKALQ